MKATRLLATALLALAIPSCHDEENVTVVAVSPTGFTPAVSVTGLSLTDEVLAGGAVGGDGLARAAFVRTSAGTTRIQFSRRDGGGAWSSPLDISDDDADAKTSIVVLVTGNNNFTHILWLEASQVRYARVNNASVPAVDAANSIISSGAGTLPSNVTAGATQGGVDELAAARDTGANDVYAVWTQMIDDDAAGAGAADEVPVAARLTAGAGAFAEYFALLDPNTDGVSSTAGAPRVRVSAGGVAHALWAGPLATGATPALRHSSRTAPAMWSGGVSGDDVSDGGAPPFSNSDFVLASDGDAYAVWREGLVVRAAHRPVGPATTFAAPGTVNGAAPAGTDLLALALEPGTEFLHVFWRAVSAGMVTFETRHNPVANLGGAWSITAVLVAPVTFAGAVDMAAWADSTNRVVFAFHAPLAAGDVSRLFVRTRPTGAVSVYSAAVNLAPAGIVVSAGLVVSFNASGNAVIAWKFGEDHAAPLADIYAVVYTTGGTFAAAVNVSASPTLGSHAPLAAIMTASGVAHVFWHESTVGPDVHDVYHTQRQ